MVIFPKKDMGITKEVVKHIAQLCRIELDQEELNYYSSQLGKVLEYIEKINQLNLEKTSFEFNPHTQTNVYRVDKSEKFFNLQGLLKIFPERENNFIKIPKVIE
ncbi:MAG TPA: Asp-tRNA(Asn)/Glu-tRNA(Gln) amidotransferase subunit GatC [Candidatus Omnitrophica bacterium]|nr:MAG: Asp-tRNA(Asn)/Glu-tRNA(Gln) amidotransferase subunit GatB [Candidatus Omnitrophota bacterium]HEC68785.1 Asp-tRNA(Asn)/Glu-tRNA(Gln) amidotransferase subunit GatC [Candidatus Omnitrophota bacterium]